MNRYSRDRLMRSRRDGRNAYGSKGGYVVSSRRDRARSGGEYRTRIDGEYRDREDRHYGEDRRYGDPGYPKDDRDYGYGYGVGMFDYEDDYNYDDRRYDRRYDRAYERDYAEEEEMRLTSKDIKKWEKDMENADGTTGKHYDMEKIRRVAEQLGITFKEFSPELLCVITNMMYSDYCKVLGNDLAIYVKLAKAFLEDDDFDGDPEEKAYLYYKCIVDKED